MSGLCQVPTPELGSCPAYSPRAVQAHESFPCTHIAAWAGAPWSLLPLPEPGRDLSPAGVTLPCPALPFLRCPMAKGMNMGRSVLRSSSQPCTQGFPGDVTLWKLQEQLKVFVLTRFMSPHTQSMFRAVEWPCTENTDS